MHHEPRGSSSSATATIRLEDDRREKIDPHRPQLVAHLPPGGNAKPAALVTLHPKSLDHPLRRERLLGDVEHLRATLLPRIDVAAEAPVESGRQPGHRRRQQEDRRRQPPVEPKEQQQIDHQRHRLAQQIPQRV